MRPHLVGLLALIGLFFRVGIAQDTQEVSQAPVFVFTEPNNAGDIIFAASFDQDAASISFYMSKTGSISWFGVGIGTQMKDSLMFIAYPAANKTSVVISPRIAVGHTEPSYFPSVSCRQEPVKGLKYSNTIIQRTISASATCTGLKSWDGWNQLNFSNPVQPFFFAVGGQSGPAVQLASDSHATNLPPHLFHALFTFNLTAAAAATGVPPPNDGSGTYVQTGTILAGPPGGWFNPAPFIHGLAMGLTWIVIFPIGTALLHLMNKVLWHALCQTIGVGLFVFGAVYGIRVSQYYNKSRSFVSAHQIIGFVLIVLVAFQFAFGLINHQLYTKTHQGTVLGTIHRFLGPTALLLGLINCFVGLDFGGNQTLSIPLGVIMGLILLLLFSLRLFLRRRRQRAKSEVLVESLNSDVFQTPQAGPSTVPAQFGGPQQASSLDHGVQLAPYRSDSANSRSSYSYRQPTQSRPTF